MKSQQKIEEMKKALTTRIDQLFAMDDMQLIEEMRICFPAIWQQIATHQCMYIRNEVLKSLVKFAVVYAV